MPPICLDISDRNPIVWSWVCLLISSAELKFSMQFGIEKYSGSAMKAGFSLAALSICVEASSRFFLNVSWIVRWSTHAFMAFCLWFTVRD